MNQTFIYDLEFVTPNRRRKSVPEVVFAIEKQYLEEVVSRLQTLLEQGSKYTANYLKDDLTGFQLPIPDLFGNKEFGFGRCGYFTIDADKVRFHFQLRPHPWTRYCSLTIFFLVKALSGPFEAISRSNRKQSTILITLAEWRSSGYGHAVGGWVSMEVINWLRNYAKDKVKKLGIITAAPMPEEVTKAQQATCVAIYLKEDRFRAEAGYNSGWVRETGAFTLNCFGDACDLSVYPDQWLGDERDMVELNCHNLDSADQQLVLLAGFATLCQLARQSS